MSEWAQLGIVLLWAFLWLWAAILAGALIGRGILWLLGARP
jgi:hypothetical protein